jgi:hypothetical protein
LVTRADIIGSSVNDTSMDTSTAADTVMPNSRKNLPIMPPVNATGPNTATIVNVVAMTASAISPVPRRAAVTGSSPRSMWRKMFSRTTTESSMSRPIASDSPIIDMMLSVNPHSHITKNVAITDTGSATAEIMVERQSSMNTKITMIANTPPSSSASSSS